MFYFKIFKKINLILFLLSVLVLSFLFLNTNSVSAAGVYPYCRGPLQGAFAGPNDQFSCPLSGVFTNDVNYPYICTDNSNIGGDIYCDPYQSNLGLSGYRNCSSATNNGSEWEVVGCSSDVIAPTIINFTATPASSNQINLSWQASDNIGVTQIEIQRSRYACGINGCVVEQLKPFQIIINDGSVISYLDTGLPASYQVCYVLVVYDAARQQTSTSGFTCATTLSDSTSPFSPTLSSPTCSSASCSLSWAASTDTGGSGLGGYRIYRNGAQVGTAAANATTYSDPGLSPLTSYNYYIIAYDNANNSSLQSNTVTGTTAAAPDTTAPTSANPNIQAALDSANPSSQINISWNAYTDNVGVAGYRIERCQGAGCSNFVQINTSVAPNYSDSGLSPSTSYSYRIRAYDAANNFSGYSNVASATTAAPPDTTPPVFAKTAPADILSAGTLSTNLSGSTNETAVCRWADSAGQPFDSMSQMNPIGGGMNHSANIINLVNGQSYYVKCRDTASTPNTSGDFLVFSVDSVVPDTSPPQISNGQPSGTLPYSSNGTNSVTMSVVTNKPAFCRYSQTADTSFDLMAASPLNTVPASDPNYQKYHFTILTVFNGANYAYYVRCQDATGGYTNNSDYPITFSVGAPPNILPTVNLTASPTSGNAPLQVNASGIANDPDGDLPLLYSLDWGDGLSENYAPNTIAQHTYNNAGSYTITLTVVDARGGRASDIQPITVNAAPQANNLPPVTGGICAVECNNDNDCVSNLLYGAGFVCGPSRICVSAVVADVGPVRSGGYASLTDGSQNQSADVAPASFPAGIQTVMIGLTTDTNAECRFAVNQSTNNGKAGVAYDFSGAGIIMNQFSTSDYRRHSAIISIGTAKSCSPGAPNSCGYDKEDACPASGKCDSYGFSAVCRNTAGAGTLAANTTDYPIRFTIGAPDLLSCVSGEICPSGLPCPANNRCEPAPYTCLINKYFVRNNIPYLLDVCFPAFTPQP